MTIEQTTISVDPDFTAEETALWDDYWRDPESANVHMRLVELYLPLVAKVANHMPNSIRQHSEMAELLSSGVVGLHDAISNYSAEKGISFSSFAYKRIRGSILDDLRKQDHLTRTQRSHYREINETIAELSSKLSRQPTTFEVAESTGFSVREIDRYLAMGSQTLNLHDEFSDGLSYIDVIADHNSQDPSESAHQSLAMEKLRDCYRNLDEREQKILYLRHFEEMSVKEIAKILEISEGRISQIYQRIVVKLRAMMQAD